MMEKVKSVLASSHKHMKIRTKLRKNIESQLKSSGTEVLHLGTYIRGHLETGSRDRDMKQASSIT